MRHARGATRLRAMFGPGIAALALCLAFGAAHAGNVTVFAAASLKESLDAVSKPFEAASGHKVVISYAGSNALAKQIENGAPADLFISADTDWIDYVEQRNLVAAGSRRNLLANDLVLIAPATSTVQLKLAPGVNVAQVLGDRRIALANPDAVPAGKYARAAFTSMGSWSAIEPKVAAADNVRAALALVARGEAPLGVVYRTDALAEKNVRIVDTFPAGSHPAIVYPIVRLARSTSAAASTLAAYLASPAARATFERYGFRAP
jgi:molybdate transport system substrate-binding protein